MTQKQCELCSSQANVQAFEVSPQNRGAILETSVLLCHTCREQIEGDAPLNANHWHCLNESIWSESTAVKVLAWRLLSQLTQESWAQDLLDQVYLDDEALQWAKAGLSKTNPQNEEAQGAETKDSNGTVLKDGDSVTLIKDLDVKGGGFTAKRGTLVRNITLTGDPANIEGRINGSTIVLKTQFLKKAT